MCGRSKTINFSTVMKLRISELTALGPSSVVNANAKEIGIEDDILTETIPIQLSISPVGNDFRVVGSLSVPTQESCDRCLVEFKEDITTNFEVIIASHDSSLSESDEVEVLVLNPGQLEVDLGPIIRDSIAVERSMKNLCSKDCNGICPHCGINLNNEDCSCSDETTDERWAPLKNIKFSTTEH